MNIIGYSMDIVVIIIVMWYVYILKCSDDTLYTGITTDIKRRIIEHNSSPKWAKYTRWRRPVELVHSENAPDKSEASKREIAIKSMSKLEKMKLIASNT